MKFSILLLLFFSVSCHVLETKKRDDAPPPSQKQDEGQNEVTPTNPEDTESEGSTSLLPEDHEFYGDPDFERLLEGRSPSAAYYEREFSQRVEGFEDVFYKDFSLEKRCGQLQAF